MTVGSQIEFLIWMLIAASVIALAAARLRFLTLSPWYLEAWLSDHFICLYCKASLRTLLIG